MNGNSVDLRALCVLCALLVLSCFTAPAMAQDGDDGDSMDFSEDEASMDFSEDEAEAVIPTEGMVITGVILPSDPDVSAAVTQRMSDVLLNELDKLEGYQNTSNIELVNKFSGLGQQGSQDCLYNPMCLSRLGKELGLQRMVVGRLGGYDGDYSLNMDLVNVEEGTVEDYVSRSIRGGEAELKEMIVSAVPRLFKVRLSKKSDGQVVPVPEIGPVQKTLAWSSAGLSLACIGVGVFFGLEAADIESGLEDGSRVSNGGISVLATTQVEAQVLVEDAESKALLANVFYGAGVAMALTSALLFFIRPGSDIATEQELSGGVDFSIEPMVGADSAGLSAGFTW